MKIAQIAPLFESVPPTRYGGTERIVSYLTEELVRRGHEVTLFASGDSITRARLVPGCRIALRLDGSVRDHLPYHMIMLEKMRQRAHAFDVLHFHMDLLHFPLVRSLAQRNLTTLHGRLDLPDLWPFYAEFPELPLVSISDDQRKPLPNVNWIGTVHHGLPRDLLPFRPGAEGGYLAFLGRICPEKRPDDAIRIASRAGLPLRIAAKVDKADQLYWNEVIAPMILGNPLVEFMGEIDEAQKADFLGNARALLFPVDWPEPFGIVMIEAMSCGTPVIAYRRGSVPEVVENGISGFVIDDIDQAVDAVAALPALDRHAIRRAFELRFTVEQMADRYEEIYCSLGDLAPQFPHSIGVAEPRHFVS